jgi:hypothetical protein
MQFADTYKSGNFSLRVQLAVVVNERTEGLIINLKKVRMSASKIAKLQATLEKRLLIPKHLHLTYRNKIALGATIPLFAGAGPLALVIPAALII